MDTLITTIGLVRHGETEWNFTRRYQGQTDIPLNDTGLAQAARVAQVLAEGPAWDAIVSSPLSRALETARAIATATGIAPIQLEPDLRERGYGDAEGLTADERVARWAGTEWPNLEPYELLQTRGVAAVDRIARDFAGQRILVVCHGGLMNAVLAHHSGGEHGTGVTVILNTAITILTHANDSWTIDTVTDASHLELSLR